MSVLNEKAIYELKWNYNNNLIRFYNGCKYLENNRDKIDKYINEILDIKNNIEVLLEEIQKYEKVTEKEILGGFDICWIETKR